MRQALTLAMLAALVLAAAAAAQEEEREQPTRLVTDHWSRYTYPTTFPAGARVYIIVRGDTLWDIAERHYDNPLVWPNIHSANPYIADPHWIYPGDPLVLPGLAIAEPGRVVAEAGAVGEEGKPEEQPRERPAAAEPEPEALEEEFVPEARTVFATEPRQSPEYRLALSELDLYCSCVVYPVLPDTDLWVIGKEEAGQIEASTYDIVYMNHGRDRVAVGDMFVTANLVGPVSDPLSDSQVGTAFQEVGLVRVILAGEDHAVAEVVMGCDGLTEGAILTPYEPRPNPVVWTRRVFDTEAQYIELGHGPVGAIVYTNYESLGVGTGDVVAINLGSEHGLRIGDRVQAFRSRSLSTRNMQLRRGDRVQVEIHRVVAELIVFRVFSTTATGRITYAVDSLRVGDLVTPAPRRAAD